MESKLQELNSGYKLEKWIDDSVEDMLLVEEQVDLGVRERAVAPNPSNTECSTRSGDLGSRKHGRAISFVHSAVIQSSRGAAKMHLPVFANLDPCLKLFDFLLSLVVAVCNDQWGLFKLLKLGFG